MASSNGRKGSKPSARRAGARPGGSGQRPKPGAPSARASAAVDEVVETSAAETDVVDMAESAEEPTADVVSKVESEAEPRRSASDDGDDGGSGRLGGLAERWPGFIRPWLGTVIRVALGAIWIVAGAEKVSDPAVFVRAVRAYEVVPEWLVKGIGYGLPFLEITVGVLLILGIGTRITAIAAGFLFVVFLIGIIQASARGLQIDCGCFGGGGSLAKGADTTYTLDILRDIGLLILALYLIAWPITKYALDDLVRKGGEEKVTGRVGVRRTKEAQRRLAELQAKRRREASKRIIAVSAAAAVVIIGVGFIGIGVQSHRASVQAQASQIVVPTIANGDGVVVGKADAPVTVDIYEDFICPYCKQFQDADGSAIDAAIKDGTANFRFHMLNFLDPNSSPAGYSSRAASASMCMPDTATWEKFHDLLYANQPAEGSAGLTTAQLTDYAKQVGATDKAVADCISSEKYKPWITKVTDNASKDKVTGTPTLRIKGQDLVGAAGGAPTAAELTEAIKVGHATGSKSGGSKVWLIIVIVVVVIGVAFVFMRSSSSGGGSRGGSGRSGSGRSGSGNRSGSARSGSARSGSAAARAGSGAAGSGSGAARSAGSGGAKSASGSRSGGAGGSSRGKKR
jgi:protein-disulfide isomerase/uncharacterized membrane protein YphA (DoxX/SURF4 family)